MPGEGQTDRQGVCLQEIPQKRRKESPQGCQERNHDPEIVRRQAVNRWMDDWRIESEYSFVLFCFLNFKYICVSVQSHDSLARVLISAQVFFALCTLCCEIHTTHIPVCIWDYSKHQETVIHFLMFQGQPPKYPSADRHIRDTQRILHCPGTVSVSLTFSLLIFWSFFCACVQSVCVCVLIVYAHVCTDRQTHKGKGRASLITVRSGTSLSNRGRCSVWWGVRS